MRHFRCLAVPALLAVSFACSDSSDSPETDTQQMSALPEDGESNGSESDGAGSMDTDGSSAGSQDDPDPSQDDGDGAATEDTTPNDLTDTDDGSSAGDGEGNADGDSDAGDGEQDPDGEEPGEAVAEAVCPEGPFAAEPLEGAGQPVAVCGGMDFTEGAVWFAERNTLYFSDITFGGNGNAGEIFTFTPGGECQVFVDNAGTNGLVIGPDGNLLGARHGDQTLTSFNLETGQPTVLLADNGGEPFNSPNDITIRSDGNLYFTDPNYGLGGAGGSNAPTGVYRLAPDGVLSRIDEGGNPNGVTLSPDEGRLYVSHLEFNGASDVVVFDLDTAGAPGEPQPFANFGSDGMGMDCAGNLYTTTNGAVQILNPAGQNIGTINAPGAANVAFGGPERRTLYITAGSNLLEVELAIPGMPY